MSDNTSTHRAAAARAAQREWEWDNPRCPRCEEHHPPDECADTHFPFERAGALYPEEISEPRSLGVRMPDVYTCLRCGALVVDGWQPHHENWHDEDPHDG